MHASLGDQLREKARGMVAMSNLFTLTTKELAQNGHDKVMTARHIEAACQNNKDLIFELVEQTGGVYDLAFRYAEQRSADMNGAGHLRNAGNGQTKLSRSEPSSVGHVQECPIRPWRYCPPKPKMRLAKGLLPKGQRSFASLYRMSQSS